MCCWPQVQASDELPQRRSRLNRPEKVRQNAGAVDGDVGVHDWGDKGVECARGEEKACCRLEVDGNE